MSSLQVSPPAAALSAPQHSQTGAKVVVNCYSFFDAVFPTCGMLDYTEGMYHGDKSVPYDVAQSNQIDYVLDQVGCCEGSRVLEIGCGNGNLLEMAQERGARIVGITISPEQVSLCQSRGLDARLLNYRDIGPEWTRQFDSVIANGPVEHFVQPKDAAQGRTDAIYREFFEICHRAIDPMSPVQKFITTTIHFVRRPDPRNLLRSPWMFLPSSDDFHWAWLAKSFGGWYPEIGQFARCTEGLFSAEEEIDGTIDYCWTSEAWLERVQAEIRQPAGFAGLFRRSLPFLARHPKQAVDMLVCMLVSQSWNWQFRTENPPTRLLRTTWRYQPT